MQADDAMRVVLARSGANALVLWNATPLVADIVARHVNEAGTNAALERGALRAAALKMPSLADAKTITVRVLYDKTGGVSPIYGAPTFAGVERYAILLLDGAKARSDADHWRELDDNRKLPTWIKYQVVGAMPPH